MDPANRILTRLGVTLSDERLLSQALTHRSAGRTHNERLEFLGDAVLELVVTDWLYRVFPEAAEGDLTRLRARLVRKESLAVLAREVELGPALSLGEGELKSGGRHRDSILADGFEAVLGAVYLDRGLQCCEEMLLRLLQPHLAAAVEAADSKDPKTRLQEWLQSRSMPLPEYEVVETHGADHAREFVVDCRIAEADVSMQGLGSSRRKAEQRAAERALQQLTSGGGRG